MTKGGPNPNMARISASLWTDELEKLLYDNVIKGDMSFGEATGLPQFRALGFTRSALIGKANRKGWSTPTTRSLRPKMDSGPATRNGTKYKTEPKPMPDVVIGKPPLKLHITQLTNASCRYIYGDTSAMVGSVHVMLKDYYYCGVPEADVRAGRCFCKAHHAAVYVTPKAYQNKKQDYNWKTRR